MSNDSTDKAILNSWLTKLIVLVVCLILLSLLWLKITADKDVDPVLKETDKQIDQTEQLLKDKPDEKDVPTAKPIDDIPVIRLQPDKPKADTSPREFSRIKQELNRYCFESKCINKKSDRDNKHNIGQPEETNRGSTQALNPLYVLCKVEELDDLDPSIAYECVNGEWVK